MKLINKIVLSVIGIALLLLLISFLIGFRLDNFQGLFNGEYRYEKAEPYITTNELEKINIKIDSENITIKSHDKKTIEVHYFIKDNQEVEIKENNNILELNVKQTFKLVIFQGIFQYAETKIEVFIPKNNDLVINIDLNAGNIKFEDIQVNTLEVKCETGNTTLKNVNSSAIGITSNTGNIILNEINSSQIDINKKVGNIDLKNTQANIINIVLKTGNITLKEITTTNIDVTNNVGNISSTNIQGNTINLYTKTGNIDIKENNLYTITLKINNVGNISVKRKKQSNYYQDIKGDDIFNATVSEGNIDYN